MTARREGRGLYKIKMRVPGRGNVPALFCVPWGGAE